MTVVVVIVVSGGDVDAGVVVGEVPESGVDTIAVGAKGTADDWLNIGTKEAEFEELDILRVSDAVEAFKRDANGKMDS